MVDRISSFTQTSQLLDNNLRIQSKYAEGQVQISTGLKSETYDGIAADTNQILNLESEYAQLTAQAENAEIALGRTELMFDALTNVIDVAQGFLGNLNSASSGLLDSAQIATLAETALNQVAAALNVQIGGRYVLSGSDSQTAPVDLNAAGFGGAVIPSVADTSYYQGNTYIQSVEASNGFTVNYGLTADDTGIEQIIRALDLVRTTPGDAATLQEASTVLNAGLDALIITKAEVGQSSQALTQAIDNNLEQINLVDNLITNLKEVDLAEVSIKLQELSAQLEASYVVTTDLIRLNLVDFL